MATCVNLAKKKRAILTVTLPDETIIMLKSPTYELMTTLQAMGDEAGMDIETAYDVAHAILNNNKVGKVFDLEYVRTLDFESVYELMEAYAAFCQNEVIPAAKN